MSVRPRSFEDAFSVFQELGYRTWDRLVDGATWEIPPTEDGLTADLLLDIRRTFANRMVVRRFSGTAEGGRDKPNADWEWWIGQDGVWIPLRVQAKQIDPLRNAFPEFADKPKTAPLQALRLITNRYLAPSSHPAWAGSAGLYRYPIYCLYTATTDDSPASPLAPRPQVPDKRIGDRRSFGCSLVGGPAVLDGLIAMRASLRDLVPLLIPWARLFSAGWAPRGTRPTTIQLVRDRIERWVFRGPPRPPRSGATYAEMDRLRARHRTQLDAEPPLPTFATTREATTDARVLPPPRWPGIPDASLPPFVSDARSPILRQF